MGKISEIVKLHTGYASAVDLRSEFEDPNKNQNRLDRYMPTKGHRKSFEKISNTLKPKDKRVYLLTGSYGTGKSHLMLMAANYLSHKSNAPEVDSFFKNYSAIDPLAADRLQALRSQGRYLVAICDYGTKDDFAEIVLRAIDSACKREGFEGSLTTHYQEAIRCLTKWEEDSRRGHSKMPWLITFEEELARMYPGVTINKLKTDLGTYTEQSMRIFREVYREIADRDFSFDKSNLVPILKDFLSAPAFKAKYKGLAILFDEFGYTLQHHRLSVEIFQDFAQLCTQGESGCQDVLFIATGHKSFQSYADNWSKTDFAKVSDRMEEIPLTPDGIEDVIGAIAVPQKETTVWKDVIIPRAGVFLKMAGDCKTIGLFDWLKPAEIRSKIVENIFPMHPVATYCLLKLAQDVGSNNRSVFTFFSGEFGTEEGSFPWFINREEIISNNLLNFYTPDLLTLFFGNNLRSDNRELRDAIRRTLQDYEATQREYKKFKANELVDDVGMQQILKTMLVYEIAGLPITIDTVMLGLYSQEDSKKSVLEAKLQMLVKGKVLYYDKQKKCYEFKRSESIDFDELLENYKDDSTNYPEDIAEEWMDIVPFGKEEVFIEAKAYNSTYSEDKRFLRVITSSSNLKEPEFYTELLTKKGNAVDWKTSAEGVAVYVICQTQDEIEKAKQHAVVNPYDSVAIAIPNEPFKALEYIMNIKAAKAVAELPEFANYSTQDKARLAELLGDASRETGYLGDFIRSRRKLLEGKGCTWYGCKGILLEAKPANESAAVDRAMVSLYTKRNRLAFHDLNQSHKIKYTPNQHQQLRDAIIAILDYRRPIKVDTSYGTDKGVVRYVYKLANHGLFVETGKPENEFRFYTVERDGTKYREMFPALADMVQNVQSMKANDVVKIHDIMKGYVADPYGVGPIALALFMGIVLRISGDTLRVKKDPTAIGDMPVKDYEVLYDLMYGEKYPNAIFQHRTISKDERAFLKMLGETFSGVGTVGKDWTVTEVYDALKSWWSELPVIAKSNDFYKLSPDVGSMVKGMASMEHTDAYNFIFSELQSFLGFDRDEAITKERTAQVKQKLGGVKRTVEATCHEMQRKLMLELGKVFDAVGNTYEAVREALYNWYNGLDDHQRTVNLGFDSKQLLKAVQGMTDVEITLFEKLPADYGFGQVADWSRDRITEYVAKVNNGKLSIEANKLRVKIPEVKVTGGVLKEHGGSIKYRKNLDVVITVPEGATKIYVTDNGDEPNNAYSQRAEAAEHFHIVLSGGNKTILSVAMDQDGNYSEVLKLDIIDEDKKYEFTLNASLFETKMVGVVPRDRDSLRIATRSLLSYCMDKEIIGKEDLEVLLKELIEDLI